MTRCKGHDGKRIHVPVFGQALRRTLRISSHAFFTSGVAKVQDNCFPARLVLTTPEFLKIARCCERFYLEMNSASSSETYQARSPSISFSR